MIPPGEELGVLPYMGYIDMCRCEGYGFQAVYTGIWEIGFRIGYHFKQTDQFVKDFSLD